MSGIDGFDANRIDSNGNGRVLFGMIRDHDRETPREMLVDAGGGTPIAKLTVAPAPPP